MRKLMWAWTLVILSAMVGLGNGAGAEKSATPTKEEVSTSVSKPSFKDAYRGVKNSVVTIKVVKQSGEVVGTGVIVDERGYIVTNRHVVNEATKVTVKFLDKTEYTAKINMMDAAHDLAVLKISGDKAFKAVRFGPTSNLEVGDDIFVVGAPYGFNDTMNKGMVSNLGRSITMPDGVEIGNLIQHDAPIDPGNSGGPVFNLAGELIGINVALHQKSRAISFALNGEDVQKVLTKQLSAVKLSGLNHGLTTKVELAETEGQKVYILDVEERSLAAEAGLKYGDQLVKVGSYDVCNKFDVERAFWDASGTVTVTVIRKGETVTVKMDCSTQSARNR